MSNCYGKKLHSPKPGVFVTCTTHRDGCPDQPSCVHERESDFVVNRFGAKVRWPMGTDDVGPSATGDPDPREREWVLIDGPAARLDEKWNRTGAMYLFGERGWRTGGWILHRHPFLLVSVPAREESRLLAGWCGRCAIVSRLPKNLRVSESVTIFA